MFSFNFRYLYPINNTVVNTVNNKLCLIFAYVFKELILGIRTLKPAEAYLGGGGAKGAIAPQLAINIH